MFYSDKTTKTNIKSIKNSRVLFFWSLFRTKKTFLGGAVNEHFLKISVKIQDVKS